MQADQTVATADVDADSDESKVSENQQKGESPEDLQKLLLDFLQIGIY